MDGIEVMKQDGPARLGMLRRGATDVPTPGGFYLVGSDDGVRRYQVGLASEVLVKIPPLSTTNPPEKGPAGDNTIFPVIVRPGISPNPDDYFYMVEAGPGASLWKVIELVIALREEVSPNAAILVADVDLWAFPLLALAGVDLLGDSHARSFAVSGGMLFESYSLEAGNLERGSCSCPVCRDAGFGGDPALHNRWVMARVLSEIRNRIGIEEIKLLAEERSVGHPEENAALKRLYTGYSDYLERHTTIAPGVRS